VKLKQLLIIISASVPFTPNISKLSSLIGVTRDTIIKYLSYLEKAQLISLLRSNNKGISKMAKPEKIFLNNNNLMFALQSELINQGTMRETFFQNQVSSQHKVAIPQSGDFIIDDKYTFEIGGKNKTYHQIANLENSFIVSDNIEYGFKNKIPLWLFGFLY
jgi:predicted AAA+ superfamily ATPase